MQTFSDTARETFGKETQGPIWRGLARAVFYSWKNCRIFLSEEDFMFP